MTPEAQAQIINALIANGPAIITAVGGVITTVAAFFVGLYKEKPKPKPKKAKASKDAV